MSSGAALRKLKRYGPQFDADDPQVFNGMGEESLGGWVRYDELEAVLTEAEGGVAEPPMEVNRYRCLWHGVDCSDLTCRDHGRWVDWPTTTAARAPHELPPLKRDQRVVHSSEIADDPAAFAGEYVPVADFDEIVQAYREMVTFYTAEARYDQKELK